MLGFVAGLLAVRTDAACITQPIMGGADPAVIYTNGFFYSLRTTGGDVRIRRSTTLAGVASGTEVTVFTPPAVWSRLTNKPYLLGQQWQLALPVATNGSRFYRLQSP